MALLKRRADAHAAIDEVRPVTCAELVAVMTSGTDAAERRAAAIDLGTMPEGAADLACALSIEANLQVRAAIISALVAIGNERAVAGLIALVGSEDAALRNSAADALRDIGSPARIQLEATLQSPDQGRRIIAVTLLASLTDREAIDLLSAALAHEQDLNVGLAIVEALSHSGGPHDIPALQAFAARFQQQRFAVELACRRTTGSDKR